MPVRKAAAEWLGEFSSGAGRVSFGGGDAAYSGPYSAASRFEEGQGTNPEELIGAAHAGCFSMALAAGLGRAGHAPKSIRTSAQVHIDKGDAGWTITRIELETVADIPGLEQGEFERLAEEAKRGCPVSRALSGVTIELKARLA